jgi:branched-chain amino acid transport system permease protein
LGFDIELFLLDFTAFVALYLAISLSLNLEFGFTGIPNFGKVLFIAGGAAVAGSLSGRLAAWVLNVDTMGDFVRFNSQIMPQVNSKLQGNIPLSIAILLFSVAVAAGTGGAFGYVFSYPAIKLREDYLAITLLAMAQFFQIFLNNYYPMVGGSLGLELPDPFAWAGDLRYVAATGAIVVFAVFIFIYMEKIARAPLGRTLRAIRDNEISSEALGKDDVSLRRKTLVTASAISGIAGALYAFYTVDVLPETYSRVAWTFWPWVIVIMGGAASNFGVAIGVLIFWFLIKSLDVVKYAFASVIPFDVTWLEYILIGGILIVILMIRPEGIVKEKPTLTLSKTRLRTLIAQETTLPLPIDEKHKKR